MKKAIFISLTILLIFTAVSCKSTSPNLVAVTTTGDEFVMPENGSLTTLENGNLTINAAGGPVVDKQCYAAIAITNTNKAPYNFTDTEISVYYGNIKTGKWKLLNSWTAEEYFKEAKKAYKSDNFWSGVGSLFDFLGDMVFDGDNFGLGNGNSYKIKTNSQSYSNEIIASMMADIQKYLARKDSNLYIEYIESSLLYSSSIPASATYSGWVVFDDMKKKGPDYRVDFTNSETGEVSSIYFVKSDRKK
ncbi:MAG: hypothetical protein K6F82_02795 [Sphaerochaetaceae bacterium]|nr:hypothetical protein [Sphaerochaetaceae bacterium]